MSSSRVGRARQAGLLVPLTSRVLRIASTPVSLRARCMAVQLHTDRAGFVSGWTAARLRGLRSMPSSAVHYTLPTRRRANLPEWVSFHRTGWYSADRDRELHEGLVVATPERMLFGLAASFNQYRFERAAEDTWNLGLTGPSEMARYLEEHRCRGKDGVSTVERWLERALPRDRPAQSGLELDLIDALGRARLPTPTRQHPLELRDGTTIHLDIAWPAIRLAVEPGATWWHGGEVRQRRDQRRDLACAELGWQVLRFDESIRSDLAATARRIRTLHRQRSSDLRTADSLHPTSR